MSSLSRTLAILITAGSLAFLGVVCVMIVGGPNWEAEMRQVPGYQFERSEGETVQWSAKPLGGPPVGGSTPIPPKAIVAARQDLLRKQQEELRQLRERKEALQPYLDTLKALLEADELAMDRRLDDLEADLTETTDAIAAITRDIEQVQNTTLETWKTAARRRDDVYFQGQQVAEIEADRDRHRQLVDVLKDRLVRIEGAVGRLRDRREQLANRLAPADATASAPPAATER